MMIPVQNKEEYYKQYLSEHEINLINISFCNNGMFDDKSIYRPILKDGKVIGCITDVDKTTVYAVVYYDIVPEIYNKYVCGVELRDKY